MNTTTTTIPQYNGTFSIEFDPEIGKYCCMHGVYEMWTNGASTPRKAQFTTLRGAIKFMEAQGIALAPELTINEETHTISRTDDIQHALEDDESFPASPEQLQTAWDKLLETPSYVERDLRDVRMFIEAQQEELAHIEDDIRSGNIPLVPMENQMLHCDERPFCADPTCPCHQDDALFDEHILEPMLAGLMTSFEASRIMWNEQV